MTPDELRTLFLFERLTDEQLARLAACGSVREVPGGSTVFAEGEPATEFFILLSGALSLSRRVQQDEIELTRTDQRGAYMGATQAYLGERAVKTYTASMRAITDCTFFVLPGDDFGAMVREWFPMAIHLLDGLFLAMRNSQAIIGERERLTALGSLAAGLMHELNNPAAAAVRATSALRQRVAGMRHKLGLLAEGRIDPAQMRALARLQESVIERAAKAPRLSAIEASDREDELGDWLDEQGVTGGWELAPVLTQGGMDLACLDDIAASVDPGLLDQSLHWIGYALETEQLMTDIEDATARISALVSAAKQYSQLDRASHQWIDVHDGLDSTLVMLAAKIGPDVTVVKEYDRSLPKVPAHAAELNQVWTNLIDNAVHAMNRNGTLTIRTSLDGERVLVEVCDTGPGVPRELTRRIFEPFFTTKPVGEGTGLGLDISYRIVVTRHRGDLSVTSAPGDTRFQVRLPLTEPASN
jgi:signal transduction histidine kinase